MPFSHHEPCPKCREIGLDRKGNNLARYTDGSAWCFSCSYKERATIFRGEGKKIPKPIPELSEEMPVKNKNWLLQYLNQNEIDKYFKYSESHDGHVFTHMEPDGGMFWEVRCVDPKKVTSGGHKPQIFLGSGQHLVIVEDIVSAIKVARQYRAMPLFGAHMQNDWIVKIAKNRTIGQVTYWLDHDKKQQALEYVRKTILFRPTNVVFTENDPKDYTDAEIREFLGIHDPKEIILDHTVLV